MRSIFDSKRFSSPRLSFAGRGLPERMRTTAFAFLGLTAAAGLAVVAMLAQAGWPVLSPAPLPSAPVREASVGKAVTLGHAPAASSRHRPSAGAEGGRASNGRDGGTPVSGEAGGSAPAAVESPAPVPVSETGGGGSTGGAPAGKPKDASASPPAATPAPADVPAPAPVAAPEPEATPSSTAPSGPGGSSSSAAAEHASERGIEASASHLDSADGRGNAAAVPDRG